MATGRKTGGRKRGVPNKINGEARDVFKGVFDRLSPEIEGWIRETAQGVEAIKTEKDGTQVKIRMGADPGKAAELTIRMAQHFVPKMPLEVTGKDGGPVVLDFSVDLGAANK